MRTFYIFVAVILAAYVLSTGHAFASCSHKVELLHEAVARLQDLTASTDIDQEKRDADVLVSLYKSIEDEDCVGLSKANQNVADIILAATVVVDSERDYEESGRAHGLIDFAPLIVQTNASNEASDTAPCRCAARRMALNNIFGEADSLNATWSERTTRLEADAVKGLWVYLDSMFEVIAGGGHLGAPGNDQSLAGKRQIANAQLSKHCGMPLWPKPAQVPSDCKFQIYGAPTPIPTD